MKLIFPITLFGIETKKRMNMKAENILTRDILVPNYQNFFMHLPTPIDYKTIRLIQDY